MALLQIFICLLAPALLTKAAHHFKVESWLSPIVLCYLLGMALGNSPFPVIESVANTITELTIVLAIPMLLISTDFMAWLKNARSTIFSFFLSLLAVVIASLIAALVFGTYTDSAAQISGMLVGVYTGGTPNMASIKLALGAKEETFLMLNMCDLMICGVYFVFLTTLAKKWFSRFLPPFQQSEVHKEFLKKVAPINTDQHWFTKLKYYLLPFLIALVIVGLSVGLCLLIKGKITIALIILLLTSFSILASFSPRIRNTPNAYEIGQYLLLVFSIAIGMLADFSQLFQSSPVLFFYTLFVVLFAIVLHVLFAWLFRIDVDTLLITSTAAIFGPAFIGQIAEVLDNRALIFSGITTGLIGYTVGNYLGLFVAWIIQLWS